jgi:hypothetical protein
MFVMIDSVRNSLKQDFMSSTQDMAYLVGPGVILITFSADSRLLLSCVDEDQDKFPFLDQNVTTTSTGPSSASLECNNNLNRALFRITGM